MNLTNADIGQTYIIKEIDTYDDDMKTFLFRLGCYSGEPVTVISRRKDICVVSIKEGRYSFDRLLSNAVVIE